MELSGKKIMAKFLLQMSLRKNSGRVNSWTRLLKTKTCVVEVIDHVTISSGFLKRRHHHMKACPTQSVSEEKFRESGQLNKAVDNRDTETCVVDNFLSHSSHWWRGYWQLLHHQVDIFKKSRHSPSQFVDWGSDRAIGSRPVLYTFGEQNWPHTPPAKRFWA